jgi:hypothetical protein
MPKKKASQHSLTIIPPGEPFESPRERIEIERAEKIPTPVQQFKTLPEQIAKSKVVFKNWYVPEIREKYKNFDRMKRIDLVFPYAKIGIEATHTQTLLIDTPKTEQEVEQCNLKLKILKDLGYKYCWVDETSTLFDALTQLGEN